MGYSSWFEDRVDFSHRSFVIVDVHKSQVIAPMALGGSIGKDATLSAIMLEAVSIPSWSGRASRGARARGRSQKWSRVVIMVWLAEAGGRLDDELGSGTNFLINAADVFAEDANAD